VEQQLAVEAELQRLADQGYREDEVLWVYERLLTSVGGKVRNATFEYYAAHLSESPSACCRTVWTAAS